MGSLREPRPTATGAAADRNAPDASHDTHAAQRAQVIAWRREFESLTGISASDEEKVKAWQAAHGVPSTGLVRRLTITAARATKKEGPKPADGATAGASHAAAPSQAAHPAAAPALSLHAAEQLVCTPEDVVAEQLVCLPEEGAEPQAQVSTPAGPSTDAAPKTGAAATPTPQTNTATPQTTPTPPTTPTPQTTTETAAQGATGLDAVTDTATVVHADILHAEEIFRDVPANTVSKKVAFNDLNKAWRQERQAEAALAAAKTPKAKESAESALAKAKELVAQKTQALKDFIVSARMSKDKQLRDMKKQLKGISKKKEPEKYAALEAEIKTREEALHKTIADDVDAMKHTDKGHESESVFQPTDTAVTHHDFVFPDGQHVKVRDHIVAYATTVSFGVDSEDPINHAEVKTVMQNAGLSSSKLAILQAISGFEGGFDTVNTYDRAKVTWGFVQWTGGSHSDLTQALSVIKDAYPKAFAKNFQAYGIDVVKDQIVLTLPDGTPPIVGDAAADAIMKSPKLAAALAHAGRDEDVKKGEVKAAVHIEIEVALGMALSAGKGHPLKAGDVITSEYGVGLLANTYVHSGSGAAKNLAQGALTSYVAKHPYAAGDEEWGAGAEAAILAAFAGADSDRAVTLKKILKTARGSFVP